MTQGTTTTSSRGARSRRGQVVEAASRRFTSQGFGPTSLREIAADAGMSHAGLLRHFPSKEALLESVLDPLRADTPPAPPTAQLLVQHLLYSNEVGGANARLMASIAGEATAGDHPAHDFVTETMSGNWAVVDESLQALGLPRSESHSAALRLCAAASGLVLQTLYGTTPFEAAELIGRQIASELGRRVRDGGRRSRPEAAPGPPLRLLTTRRQYPSADHRRTAIIDAAFTLFALKGYRGTTLRAIGQAAGMPHSSVLRHFPRKEMLVMEVVRLRDLRNTATIEGMFRSPDPMYPMREIVATARANASLGNVIELYTKLSCEAVYPDHPCHEYFVSRCEDFRLAANYMFARAQDAGALSPDRDPAREAQYLLAIWDGLQRYQAYFSEVDVADQLLAHLRSILDVPFDPDVEQQETP